MGEISVLEMTVGIEDRKLWTDMITYVAQPGPEEEKAPYTISRGRVSYFYYLVEHSYDRHLKSFARTYIFGEKNQLNRFII